MSNLPPLLPISIFIINFPFLLRLQYFSLYSPFIAQYCPLLSHTVSHEALAFLAKYTELAFTRTRQNTMSPSCDSKEKLNKKKSFSNEDPEGKTNYNSMTSPGRKLSNQKEIWRQRSTLDQNILQLLAEDSSMYLYYLPKTYEGYDAFEIIWHYEAVA